MDGKVSEDDTPDDATSVETPEPAKTTRWDTLSVSINRGATWIVTGADDNLVRAWKVFAEVSEVGVKSTPKMWELKGHTAGVRSLAWSFDGTMICSGSEDHTVRVWSVSTGLEILKPIVVTKWATVTALTFSDCGNKIATGSSDGLVRVWWIKGPQAGIQMFRSKHGRLWKEEPMVACARGTVNCLEWSASDSLLAAGASDCTVSVWSTKTSESVIGGPHAVANWGRVSGLSWRPTTGSRGASQHLPQLATVADDGIFSVWCIEGARCRLLRKYQFTSSALTAVRWNPPGTVVTLAFKHSARIFDIERKKLSEPLPGFAAGSCERNEIFDIAWSEDSKSVIAASGWEFRLWDIEKERQRGLHALLP